MSGWDIFFMMVSMIAGSIVLERVLPMPVKERLGKAVCWGMMAFTMTFLIASTLGLAAIVGRLVWARFIGGA